MKSMILIAGLVIATPLAAQTQMDLNMQADREWKAADAAMTVQWRRAYAYMKGLDAKDTTRGGGFGYAGALLNSQRAWLKFRDAQCVIEGGEFAGGSLQSMARLQCAAKLTRERTKQLVTTRWERP